MTSTSGFVAAAGGQQHTIIELKKGFLTSQIRLLSVPFQTPPANWQNDLDLEAGEEGELRESVVRDVLHKGFYSFSSLFAFLLVFVFNKVMARVMSFVSLLHSFLCLIMNCSLLPYIAFQDGCFLLSTSDSRSQHQNSQCHRQTSHPVYISLTNHSTCCRADRCHVLG